MVRCYSCANIAPVVIFNPKRILEAFDVSAKEKKFPVMLRGIKMHDPSWNGFSFHRVCTHMFILRTRTHHSLLLSRITCFFCFPFRRARYYDTFNGPNVIVLNDWALTLVRLASSGAKKRMLFAGRAHRALCSQELRKQQCCRSGLLLRHLAPRRVSSSAKQIASIKTCLYEAKKTLYEVGRRSKRTH